jgi:hypothetical protein
VCLHDIRENSSKNGNDKISILRAGTPATPADLPKEGTCRSAVFNVGGPVWNVEWCPVPQNVDNGITKGREEREEDMESN